MDKEMVKALTEFAKISYQYYKSLLQAGFTPDAALKLTQTFTEANIYQSKAEPPKSMFLGWGGPIS